MQSIDDFRRRYPALKQDIMDMVDDNDDLDDAIEDIKRFFYEYYGKKATTSSYRHLYRRQITDERFKFFVSTELIFIYTCLLAGVRWHNCGCGSYGKFEGGRT